MNKQDEIFDFFKLQFNFSSDGLTEFVESLETKEYRKGKVLLEPGQVEQQIKFIVSGIVREYYLREHTEININFYSNMEFATDLNSFLHNTQTNKKQECLTEVRLLSMSKQKLDAFLDTYSCARNELFNSLQHRLKEQEEAEYRRLTQCAEELYNEIVTDKQEWIKHIPQYHLASYLNITPETLSRIRKRIS